MQRFCVTVFLRANGLTNTSPLNINNKACAIDAETRMEALVPLAADLKDAEAKYAQLGLEITGVILETAGYVGQGLEGRKPEQILRVQDGRLVLCDYTPPPQPEATIVINDAAQAEEVAPVAASDDR